MQIARAIGVDGKELDQCNSKEPRKTINDAKAQDFVDLFYLLKEGLKLSSYKEKVIIITLVPESWSREYAAMFFNVSEYLV